MTRTIAYLRVSTDKQADQGVSLDAQRAKVRATLKEDEAMNATKVTAFRLPDDLLRRLDAYARRLSSETQLDVARADVVKQLLTRGLDAVEAEAAAKKAPRKR